MPRNPIKQQQKEAAIKAEVDNLLAKHTLSAQEVFEQVAGQFFLQAATVALIYCGGNDLRRSKQEVAAERARAGLPPLTRPLKVTEAKQAGLTTAKRRGRPPSTGRAPGEGGLC